MTVYVLIYANLKGNILDTHFAMYCINTLHAAFGFFITLNSLRLCMRYAQQHQTGREKLP